MRRSIAALLAVAIVMVAAAVGYAALRGAASGTLSRAKIEPSPVRVTGDIGDLFPGVTTALPIRVLNLTDGPVRLRWVRTRVRQPDGDCAPGYLHAEQIWPRQRIPAHGRLDLEVPLTLAPEAPDGCQGVKFPLRYRTRVNVLGVRG
jgi:hypothetical protein